MKKALVLGGGIQGCCLSIMLKKHGYDVKIIDKSADIFNRASLNQEGKIHMGFNYGLDSSLKTGKKLMLDALHFAPYLEYLIGEKLPWEKFRSLNFNYLVAKDSLLSPEQVESYFQTLQTIYQSFLENTNLTYLGKRPKRLFRRTPIPSQLNPDFFQACFATEEVALHPESLKEIIKAKVLSENISLCLNQYIADVKKTPTGFAVKTYSKEVVQRFESDLVFNCLWEGKLFLDKKIGIKIEKNLNMRIKFGIITMTQTSLHNLPSFTIIQGPYGDHVNYPQSNQSYFCWYHSSMKGMIVDQIMPSSWERACEGDVPNSLETNLVRENFSHFNRLIPALSNFQGSVIKAGVIVAKGHQDIHKLKSSLHERNENPITKNNGFFSISTGKFTSAPHNAYLLEKILGYDDKKI